MKFPVIYGQHVLIHRFWFLIYPQTPFSNASEATVKGVDKIDCRQLPTPTPNQEW